eukprot:TRINITY_DN657_c0_g1_i1.p1 TRINITY_DN657_c0_g1~~TRINITY_DN657_c0_g1_i1.p1  ORF type:complete len:131 (-),score=21.00 TRINITY_DN657_c0_g1_i1:73-465(-)
MATGAKEAAKAVQGVHNAGQGNKIVRAIKYIFHIDNIPITLALIPPCGAAVIACFYHCMRMLFHNEVSLSVKRGSFTSSTNDKEALSQYLPRESYVDGVYDRYLPGLGLSPVHASARVRGTGGAAEGPRA